MCNGRGTPELLNLRRGSALTKWWQKKPSNPATSPSLFIGTEELKGLTSGASAHSCKARKIRRAYPTFFSPFSYFLWGFFPPFFFNYTCWSEAALFWEVRWGRGGRTHWWDALAGGRFWWSGPSWDAHRRLSELRRVLAVPGARWKYGGAASSRSLRDAAAWI